MQPASPHLASPAASFFGSTGAGSLTGAREITPLYPDFRAALMAAIAREAATSQSSTAEVAAQFVDRYPILRPFGSSLFPTPWNRTPCVGPAPSTGVLGRSDSAMVDEVDPASLPFVKHGWLDYPLINAVKRTYPTHYKGQFFEFDPHLADPGGHPSWFIVWGEVGTDKWGYEGTADGVNDQLRWGRGAIAGGGNWNDAPVEKGKTYWVCFVTGVPFGHTTTKARTPIKLVTLGETREWAENNGPTVPPPPVQ